MSALSTVRQFAAKHQAFTVGGLRAWIFNEHTNGLANSGAIVRIGRKVLIDEAKFFAWVKGQSAFFDLVDAGVKFDLRAPEDIPEYPQEFIDWCAANGKPDPRLRDL